MANTSIPERGVYAIQCIDGRAYVGSSFDVNTRQRKHREALRRGANVNRPLQDAWTALGEDAFAFAILERVPNGDLYEAEQRWMDRFRKAGGVFNVAPLAGTNAGLKPGAETRAKMSASRTGKKAGAETLKKLSAAKSGQNHPCAKITAADIQGIRAMARRGIVQTQIASKYGISRSMVSMIASGRRWASV